MAEYYFLEVQTRQSTNSVDRYVSKAAEAYNHRVVTKKGWVAMMMSLEEAYRTARKDHPRIRKEFEFDVQTFKDIDGRDYPYCSFRSIYGPIVSAFDIRAVRVKGELSVEAEVKGEETRQIVGNGTNRQEYGKI